MLTDRIGKWTYLRDLPYQLQTTVGIERELFIQL